MSYSPSAASLGTPTHWDWHPLGRIATRSRRAGVPDAEPLSVFLDAGVVPRSSRDDNHNQHGADLSKYLAVEPGDMVFNKLRIWQGGFGSSRHAGIVSPAYFVLRPRADVDSRYLDYLLHSAPFLGELTRLSKWMPPSQFDLAWEDLAALRVPLPPLDEQRRIANYLDDQTTRINQAIQLRQHQLSALDEWEFGHYFTAVSGADVRGPRIDRGLPWLGEIPTNWQVATIGSQFEVVLGKMLNEERRTSGEQLPYLRNTNVQWGHVDVTDLKTMSFSDGEWSRYGVAPGDLLICEGGQPGRAAVFSGTDRTYYFQKALHRARTRGVAQPQWLLACLRVAVGMNVFSSGAEQTTIAHLTAEQLRAQRLPFPSLDEQVHRVRHLDTKLRAVGESRLGIERSIDLLQERRKALITAAVTGELDVSSGSSRAADVVVSGVGGAL